ncbi:ornithine cyclodeaminase family protein [soil metagenome]
MAAQGALKIIEAEDVQRVLDFPMLIAALREAFGAPASVPRRVLFRLDEDGPGREVFALLPAWTDDVIAVKAFTHMPANAAAGRETVHASILLFDRATGRPTTAADGTSITYWRTAAVSALAADYLARRDAHRLLLCGTGSLAPYMALAHAAVRPIDDVAVWGRNAERAARTADVITGRRPDLRCHVVDDLESAALQADVISCATASPEPIIRGDWVRPGTHTDFCGNHEREARECDTDLVVRARVFVDSRVNVMNEAGEILIPIAEGRIDEHAIVGELADLCTGRVSGRGADDEITLFKSVGTALSDLAAARLVAARL